jgi:hypothetical protein
MTNGVPTPFVGAWPQYFRREDEAMRGRLPKPEGERRSRVLKIRLTGAEREQFERAAKACGEDTSAWARRWLEVLARIGERKG